MNKNLSIRINTISFIQANADEQIQRERYILRRTKVLLEQIKRQLLEQKNNMNFNSFFEHEIGKAQDRLSITKQIIKNEKNPTNDNNNNNSNNESNTFKEKPQSQQNNTSNGIKIGKIKVKKIDNQKTKVDVKKNGDISKIIEENMHKSRTIKLKVVSGIEMTMNDFVKLPPKTTLIIKGCGEKHPKINMEGSVGLSDSNVPTRLLIPLSSNLVLKNVDLDIKTDQIFDTLNDYSAIFVISGLDDKTVGMSAVKMENVVISTNLSVINVGIHGLSQIILENVSFNSDDNQKIYVITKESQKNAIKSYVMLSTFNVQHSANIEIISNE